MRKPYVLFPILFMLAAVVVGILHAHYQLVYLNALLLIGCAIPTYRRLFFTLFILACVSSANYVLSTAPTTRTHISHSIEPNKKHRIGAIIKDVKKQDSLSTSLIVEAFQVDSQAVQGKIQLRQPSLSDFRIGDTLLFQSYLRDVRRNYAHPGQFNYSRFLQHQGIYYTAYLRNKGILKTRATYSFKQRLMHLRARLAKNIETYVPHPHASAIAKALLLGSKSALEYEVRNVFANTGAMHILAVSGLHTGIVYLLIHGFFGLLPFTLPRWVTASCSIALLWIYALLTGLSPSVMRAATMFSFLLLAHVVGKKSYTWHALGASAFLLLLINPHQLFSIGFQLSYVAVASILWIYPMLNKLWEPKNRIVRYFWSLTAVSLAAQIGTAPLAIYTFHQFPVYFLLANYVALPLAGILLPFGFLFLALSFIEPLAVISGHGLSYLIQLLLFVLKAISNLPMASLSPIFWTTWQCLSCYLFILVAILGIEYRFRMSYALMVFGLVLCFTTFQWTGYQKKKEYTLAVLQVPKHSVVLAEDVNGWHKLTEDSLSAWTKQNIVMPLMYSLGRGRYAKIGNPPKSGHLYHRPPVFQWFSYMGIRTTPQHMHKASDLPLDLIILSKGNRYSKPCNLTSVKPGQMLIFDSTFRRWEVDKWKACCNQHELNCHFVATDGAYFITSP